MEEGLINSDVLPIALMLAVSECIVEHCPGVDDSALHAAHHIAMTVDADRYFQHFFGLFLFTRSDARTLITDLSGINLRLSTRHCLNRCTLAIDQPHTKKNDPATCQ